jgi:type IV secretion system protein TrbG
MNTAAGCTLAAALGAALISLPAGAQSVAHRADAVTSPSPAVISAAAPGSPIEAAREEYRATGVARTIPGRAPGDFVTYPFGHARAYLRCGALVICVVELESGETPTDRALPGDPDNWEADRVSAGPEGTVQILIRAKKCDRATNVIIPTNRRRYVVDVEVPPCPGNRLAPAGEYMAGIRFWYPDDAADAPEAPRSVLDEYAIDPADVNSEYRWSVERRVSWTPVRIFDDRIRTYIQLPPESRHGEMPVLYLVASDGRRELLNYVRRADAAGDYLVLDRVIKRAQLVTTAGKQERRVSITNLLLLRREGR